MSDAGEVVQNFDRLPEAEQQKVAAEIRARSLPDPPTSYVGPLWLIVVSAFAIVMVGGGFLLYLLSNGDKSTEVVGPIVTGALGVLAGLLAPSPVSTNK
jgi:hypothetical protein